MRSQIYSFVRTEARSLYGLAFLLLLTLAGVSLAAQSGGRVQPFCSPQSPVGAGGVPDVAVAFSPLDSSLEVGGSAGRWLTQQKLLGAGAIAGGLALVVAGLFVLERRRG